jgi:hypothetical protein
MRKRGNVRTADYPAKKVAQARHIRGLAPANDEKGEVRHRPEEKPVSVTPKGSGKRYIPAVWGWWPAMRGKW